MELIIDARCNNTEILTGSHSLSNWMLDLCLFVGMTPVGEPIVKNFPWPGGDNALSAYLFLAESGIAVHCYPEFDYIFLNIFSCKRFDTLKTLKWIKRTLQITEQRSFLFERGIDMETRKPVIISPSGIKDLED